MCNNVDACEGDDSTGDTDGDGVCDDTDVCPDDAADDSDGDGSCYQIVLQKETFNGQWKVYQLLLNLFKNFGN